MPVHRRDLQVGVDYRQFYLWDGEISPDAPTEYTADTCARRINVGPHVVAVLPERNGTVPATVEVHAADPGFSAADWDHVAEASLHLPSGWLQVHECTGVVVANIAVEPGWYRVRVFFAGLATVDDTGFDGGDRYEAHLWPAPAAAVRVLVQYAET